jgi:hypothetical protein
LFRDADAAVGVAAWVHLSKHNLIRRHRLGIIALLDELAADCHHSLTISFLLDPHLHASRERRLKQMDYARARHG